MPAAKCSELRQAICGQPVVRVDMQEQPDPLHRVHGIGERRVAAFAFVIFAAHASARAGRRAARLRSASRRRARPARRASAAIPRHGCAQGRAGRERAGSSLRCEARPAPSPTGVCGSFEPMNVTSWPAGSNSRSTRKKSASVVSDDTHNLAATGPVISRLSVAADRAAERSDRRRSSGSSALPPAGLREQARRPAAKNIWSIACA